MQLDIDNSEYVKHVNRTSRSSGAVGRNPVCYQEMERILAATPTGEGSSGVRILDYGCGKGGMLRGLQTLEKYKIVRTYIPYDIGGNSNHKGSEAELEAGMAVPFDLVVLSNVLNVQPNEDLVYLVLLAAWRHVKPGGRLIYNYPTKPRHNPMTNDTLASKVLGLPDRLTVSAPTKGAHVVIKRAVPET